MRCVVDVALLRETYAGRVDGAAAGSASWQAHAMRAARYRRYGSPDVIRVETIETLVPAYYVAVSSSIAPPLSRTRWSTPRRGPPSIACGRTSPAARATSSSTETASQSATRSAGSRSSNICRTANQAIATARLRTSASRSCIRRRDSNRTSGIRRGRSFNAAFAASSRASISLGATDRDYHVHQSSAPRPRSSAPRWSWREGSPALELPLVRRRCAVGLSRTSMRSYAAAEHRTRLSFERSVAPAAT